MLKDKVGPHLHMPSLRLARSLRACDELIWKPKRKGGGNHVPAAYIRSQPNVPSGNREVVCVSSATRKQQARGLRVRIASSQRARGFGSHPASERASQRDTHTLGVSEG